MKCEKCKKREAVCEHHTKFDKITNKSDKDSPIQNLCMICHSKIHGIDSRKEELRRLVVLITRNQKARIAIDNQIRSFTRIELIVPEYFIEITKSLKKEEMKLEKEILNLLEGKNHVNNETHYRDVLPYPIWKWLKGVKGISIRLAAKIISMIDINNTPTISALWMFCGQAPGCKLQKGKKINWNPELKSYIFQLANSFIISKSPYKKIYDKEKERQLKLMETRTMMKPMLTLSPDKKKEESQKFNETLLTNASPPKNKIHVELRAKRIMVKKFLKDLWLEWRKTENLSITKQFNIQETNFILQPKKVVSPVQNLIIERREK